MIGQILGDYKILEQVGEGSMGAVYRAVDMMLEREVALKALRSELARRQDIVDRFREEAKVQARLNHPNVAQMYSLFRYGNDLYMVMEFVSGPTLDTIIRQSGRMPLDEALPIFLQALDGVEHAHRMGIIHRDLKPANIMLNRDGLVKVTDFGIARVIGAARMTREGAMIGTLEYMSPERVLGKELDARSDEYSLGFVLYEMLSGNLPFASQTEYEILRAQIETPPPPIRARVRDVPIEIEEAILKSMSKNPSDRFQTVGDFAAALRAISARAAQAVRADTPPLPPWRPAAKETVMAVSPPTIPYDPVAAPISAAGPPSVPPPLPAPPPEIEPAVVAAHPPPPAEIPESAPLRGPAAFEALPSRQDTVDLPAPARSHARYYTIGAVGVALLLAGILYVLNRPAPLPTPSAPPAAQAAPALPPPPSPLPAPAAPPASPIATQPAQPKPLPVKPAVKAQTQPQPTPPQGHPKTLEELERELDGKN